MSLSATQLLKLEGAKLGLQQSCAKYGTAVPGQEVASDDGGRMSSQDVSPSKLDHEEADNEQRSAPIAVAMESHDAQSHVERGGASDGAARPPQTDHPAADALSGVFFQHMNERGGALDANNMQNSIRQALNVHGFDVDDVDLQGPLEYVAQMFGSIGLNGEAQASRSPSCTEHVCAGAEATTASKPSENDSQSHSPDQGAQQTFRLTDAGQAILRNRMHNQNSSQSLLRHTDSKTPAAPPSPRRLAVGPYSPRPQQHAALPAPMTLRPNVHQTVHQLHAVNITQPDAQSEHAQPSTKQPRSAQTAFPQPVQVATHQANAAPQLAAETLTQVAAAAAVAAAQTVKHESDSELSQVLKAVLLQQSRLGITNSALANAVGPGLLSALGQEKSIGPRVAGHRLTEPAPQAIPPPHSATPLGRSSRRLPQPLVQTGPESPPSMSTANLEPGASAALEPPATRRAGKAQRPRQADSHDSIRHATAAGARPNQSAQAAPAGAKLPTQPSRPAQKRTSKPPVPVRHKAAVTETARSRPETPATTASRGASPSMQADSAGTTPSPPARLRHSPDEPPLHPSLQAMVDTARAALRPQTACNGPMLDPPQPDYVSLARQRLSDTLAPQIDYGEVKCSARSAAAAAQTVALAFKRSGGAAISPMPSSMLPSWHSVEAMEDLSVFATACAHEVALRAAQIQSDVMECASVALGTSGKSAKGAAGSGALSAAKALQRLSARQAASKRHAGRAQLTEEEEAGFKISPQRDATAAAAPADEVKTVPARKRSRSAGARPRKSPQPAAAPRPPLRDGSNTRAGAMSARAQAAFDRAVERRRGRPVGVAFGRRVSGAPGGEDGAARLPAAAANRPSSAGAPAALSERPADAAAASAARVVAAEQSHGPAAQHTQQQQWPGDRDAQHGDAAVHACSHMRPHVPAHIDRMMDGGSWPVHACSHVRGPPQWGPNEHAEAGAGDQHGQAGPGGGEASTWCGQNKSGAALSMPAMQPQQASSTTDAALVALLQGLTEVVRQGAASPPPLPPAAPAPPPPAPAAAAAQPASAGAQHGAGSGIAAANAHGSGSAPAQCDHAPMAQQGPAATQRAARLATMQAASAVEQRGGAKGQASAIHQQADIQHAAVSVVEAAAWAALPPAARQREFLSVVDLQRPPGLTSARDHSMLSSEEHTHSGPDQSRAAEFAALEELLRSGHSMPGSEFPFPPDRGLAGHDVMQDRCAADVRHAIEAGALRGSVAGSSLGASPQQPAAELDEAMLALPDGTRHNTASPSADVTGRRLDSASNGYTAGVSSELSREQAVGVPGSTVNGDHPGRKGSHDDSNVQPGALEVRDSVAVDILHAALEARVKMLKAVDAPQRTSEPCEADDGGTAEHSRPLCGSEQAEEARTASEHSTLRVARGDESAANAIQSSTGADLSGHPEEPSATVSQHGGTGALGSVGAEDVQDKVSTDAAPQEPATAEMASDRADLGAAQPSGGAGQHGPNAAGGSGWSAAGPPHVHEGALQHGQAAQAAAGEVVIGVPVLACIPHVLVGAAGYVAGPQQAVGQLGGAGEDRSMPAVPSTLPTWSRPEDLQERIRAKYREMRRDTALALASSFSSDDLDIRRKDNRRERQAPLVPPLRRCNSDSPETPRVSESGSSLSGRLGMRTALLRRAMESPAQSSASSGDEAAGDEAPPANVLSKGDLGDAGVAAVAEASGEEQPEECPDSDGIAAAAIEHAVGSPGSVLPRADDAPADRREAEVDDSTHRATHVHGYAAARSAQAEPVWASPSEMSPAIRQLLQPAHIMDATRSPTVPLTLSQGIAGQGALEQYATLRRKLWRPPDMEAVEAAIPDIGMPSDRSGYVSDSSQKSSMAGSGGPESNAPADALEKSASRRRRLERLQRTLLQGASVDASTSLWPSSSSASSDPGEPVANVVHGYVL
eukprot:jgi/Ulvmu1/4562/UM002_0290.1